METSHSVALQAKQVEIEVLKEKIARMSAAGSVSPPAPPVGGGGSTT